MQTSKMTTRIALALGGVLSLALAPAASAEEEVALASDVLDTITVTATKNPQNTFDIPGMVSVIDAEDPAVAGSATARQFLRNVPGLEMSGGGRRNGQAFAMRGYALNGIIVMFDGVQQRLGSGHGGQFFIDPQLIKSVEVVRGSYSALYGSGGLGGIVAFETKDAADFLASGQTEGAVSGISFQSVNGEWMGSQTGYMARENVDVMAQLNYRSSSDVTLGDGTELPSDDSLFSGLLKLGWAPDNHQEVKFGLQGYSNDAEESRNPHVDPEDQTGENFADKTSASYTASLRYAYDNPSRPLINLNANLYYTDIDLEESLLEQASSIRNEEGDNLLVKRDSLGFAIDNQSVVKNQFGGMAMENLITAGLEYYSEELESNHSRHGYFDGYPPSAESSYLGVFVQDEIKLGGFYIIPGIRYDQYDSESSEGRSQDESAVSPKLGITYRPDNQWMFFANYAQGFRAPAMSEIYAQGVHFSIPTGFNPVTQSPIFDDNEFAPNPDLKPEKSESYELGFGIDMRNVGQYEDHLKFKAVYYNISAQDYIFQNPINGFIPNMEAGSTTIENVDASIFGYEMELQYQRGNALFDISYATVDGTDDDTGAFLENLYPETVKVGFAVQLPRYKAVIGWRGLWANEHDKLGAVGSHDRNDDGVADAYRKGYLVHNLYAQWRVSGYEQMLLTFGIDNVLDEEYERVFASALEPGRNFRFGVELAW